MGLLRTKNLHAIIRTMMLEQIVTLITSFMLLITVNLSVKKIGTGNRKWKGNGNYKLLFYCNIYEQ